jgi:hypothetical protein
MDGLLFTNGTRIGMVRQYNPKRHEGYVTMDGIGREEWGAMTSDYYVVDVNGKRIPNKWDGKVDPHKAFFGDDF